MKLTEDFQKADKNNLIKIIKIWFNHVLWFIQGARSPPQSIYKIIIKFWLTIFAVSDKAFVVAEVC